MYEHVSSRVNYSASVLFQRAAGHLCAELIKHKNMKLYKYDYSSRQYAVDGVLYIKGCRICPGYRIKERYKSSPHFVRSLKSTHIRNVEIYATETWKGR